MSRKWPSVVICAALLSLAAVLSSDAQQGVQIIQNGTIVAPGQGTAATALRTTLASDSPGIIAPGQAVKSASIPVTIASDQSPSTAGLTPSTTGALSANQVVKASAGVLYSFEVSADSTLSGAAWWVILYDATAAPADGAITPRKCYAQASGTVSASYAFPTGIAFTTGITIGVSTTGCFTKTASVHAFISGDAQ